MSETVHYRGVATKIEQPNDNLHEHQIEAITLDDLKILAEEYVSDILKQMYNAIKLLL